MELKHLFLLAVLPPLLLGCGGKDPVQELPPPVVEDPEEIEELVGGGQGVEVTPLGDGWVSKTIEEGITYHSFSGKDVISGQMEEVFAVDVDLNNPNYEVKLVYTSPRTTSSEAMKRFNALVTMNANYEPGSIYIRVDGKTYSALPNATIGDTGVPNWKSEGAFACDRQRGVNIFYVGSQHHGEMTVAQQRAYYENTSPTEMPDLISSAPMLVNNFQKVGETFCNYSLTSTAVNKLKSEDPERHQRVRHPRTAIGITEKNHLIMFVVDGRTTHSSGMSCRELTRFMVKWFNPQYALNMDGGGSSTLCVKGEGDPSTHVVNYPCDNSTYDHAGERTRDVHFIVVKK